MGPLSEYPIRGFGALASLQDTTDLNNGALTVAKNSKLRPWGGISGPPRYFRLWAIGSVTNIYNTLTALTRPGGGTLGNGDDTVAVRIYRQGLSFLLLYSMPDRKARGFFYLGSDGSNTPVDFDTGPPSYEVLAIGLDRTARWYGTRTYTQIFIQNGVDDPVAVQLNRSKTPGKWRKAGSNARPAAAAIALATPASTANTQAYWTIGSTTLKDFIANAANDTMLLYTTSQTVTASAATDLFTATTAVSNGLAVALTAVTAVPAGTTAAVAYYVVQASGLTFKLSATPGGSPINLTSAGTGTITLYTLYNAYPADTIIRLSTTGTLPAGLALGTDYHTLVNLTYEFKVSLTQGGSPVDITDAGTGIHTSGTLATTQRAGGASLTFTANIDNFPGASGNNKIKVQIVYVAYGGALSSTLTGAGTVADPYIYIITTSQTENSNNALVAFVNSDTKVLGILTCSTSASNTTTDTGSYGPTLLANGSGTGTSEGFTDKTATVYLRYFDSGAEFLGYEGISSDISNSLIISAAQNNDILVYVPIDATAEGGRFDFIRVYLQFGEALAAIWNLMDPDNPTPNTARTGTFTVNTATDVITASGTHNLVDTDIVRFTNSGGALPTGLTAGTNYYVINATPTTFKVSTTQGGTAVNITTAGTGTQTYALFFKIVQLGTNTEIGPVMSVDQNRPLPHTVLTTANEQTWRGGVTGFQDRLYVSKPATNDELAPEGANSEAYERVESPKGSTGTPRMTALYSDGFKVHVHTSDAVTLIDPVDTSKRYSPPVVCGAVNQSALTPYPGGLLYYLGVDGQIYTISGLRYGKQQVEFAARDAAAYVLERTNIQAMVTQPERVNLFSEPTSQMLWYYLPAPDSDALDITATASSDRITTDTAHGLRLLDAVVFPTLTGGAGLTAGTTIYYVKAINNSTQFTVSATPDGSTINITTNITAGTVAKTNNRAGFCYDFLAKGILGEFTYPNVYDIAQLEPSRPVIPFVDEDGNLFAWDTREQLDSGNDYGSQTAPIPHSTSELPPVEFDGYGMTDFDDGDGLVRYWPSTESVWETGLIDLSKAANRKAFAGVIWSKIQGSVGIAVLTFTDMAGNEVERIFGNLADFGFQNVCKCLASINATAVSVKMKVINAQQSAWTVRSLSLLYRSTNQGQI